MTLLEKEAVRFTQSLDDYAYASMTDLGGCGPTGYRRRGPGPTLRSLSPRLITQNQKKSAKSPRDNGKQPQMTINNNEVKDLFSATFRATMQVSGCGGIAFLNLVSQVRILPGAP